MSIGLIIKSNGNIEDYDGELNPAAISAVLGTTSHKRIPLLHGTTVHVSEDTTLPRNPLAGFLFEIMGSSDDRLSTLFHGDVLVAGHINGEDDLPLSPQQEQVVRVIVNA